MQRHVLLLALILLSSGCIIIDTHDHGVSERPDAVHDTCDGKGSSQTSSSCEVTWECYEGRYLLRCNSAVDKTGAARGFFCECIEDGQIVTTFESADICQAQSMERDARTFCGWYLD